MRREAKTGTVRFAAKEQVVIPLRLCKEFEFHIEEGARAVVRPALEDILLTPVIAASIRRVRGMLISKQGRQPLAEAWPEHKLSERELEDAKTWHRQ